MPYLKTIVCLADSFKPPHGRCVAGRELWPDRSFGHWIRPISTRPAGELSLAECTSAAGARPQLLDIIEVPLDAKAPGDIQSENHYVRAEMPWIKVGRLPTARLTELRQEPWGLWLAGQDHTTQGKLDCISPANARQFLSSLLLIQVAQLTVHIAEHPRTRQPTCRGEFTYQDRIYNLSLTDPAIRTRYGDLPNTYRLGRAYLCLSLTEPYEKDGRCHKLIAAVILEGRG